ncbi:MAG TPA: hypothetical protein VFA17_08165 [Thermoplasmata archaeon]|nr:hypothetical protein [Thermoplasmata archaeon]
MEVERPSRLGTIIRFLIGMTPLALAVGYASLYTIFPSATFPATSDPSAAWILVVLLLTAVAGGSVAEELRAALVASLAAIPVGFVVGLAMAFAPAVAGLYLLAPTALPFFMAHYSIFVVGLAFPLSLVGSILGQVLRGRLAAERIPHRMEP